MIKNRRVENVRLCLHTARRRSLGACLSKPQSCETENPGELSSQTSKRPGLEKICAWVESLCLEPRVNARTHRRMDVDFRRRDDPEEVVSEQERRLIVYFELEVLAPRRGMKGEDLSTRTKLRMALGRA